MADSVPDVWEKCTLGTKSGVSVPETATSLSTSLFNVVWRGNNPSHA